MNHQSHYPVVIIGAGPVGVTAATLLAQYGITSLVLDRWAGLYPQPRAVHLDDEVYRILERLGIASEFAQISRPAVGLRLLDSELSTLVEFRRDPTFRRHGHPQANMFDQPHLEALLRANLAGHSHATLRGDAEVTDLIDLSGGRTRITFTDRSDDSVHSVECDYLLGCDGANSTVRSLLDLPVTDLGFFYDWLIVDVVLNEPRVFDPINLQICDPLRPTTAVAGGPGRRRWEFMRLPEETIDELAADGRVWELLAPWDVRPDNATVERSTVYTFNARHVERWRSGRVLLDGRWQTSRAGVACLAPPRVLNAFHAVPGSNCSGICARILMNSSRSGPAKASSLRAR